MDIAGVNVCAVTEVLDRLRGRQRTKGRQRATVYADVQARAAGPDPRAVAGLLDHLRTPAPETSS